MMLVESQEPWLGKVPGEWVGTRIRNVSRLSPGYSGSPPAADELCTVVPMESLFENGTLEVSNQQLFEDVQRELTLFEQGDVLFAKITPCMENGKGAFVENVPVRYAYGSTEFHVLRPLPGVDGKFLYYATFNPIFRAYAAENMTGAAGQKRVSSRFLKDTHLFLPPLPEQRLIAAYLDASCASIDAGGGRQAPPDRNARRPSSYRPDCDHVGPQSERCNETNGARLASPATGQLGRETDQATLRAASRQVYSPPQKRPRILRWRLPLRSNRRHHGGRQIHPELLADLERTRSQRQQDVPEGHARDVDRR